MSAMVQMTCVFVHLCAEFQFLWPPSLNSVGDGESGFYRTEWSGSVACPIVSQFALDESRRSKNALLKLFFSFLFFKKERRKKRIIKMNDDEN